MQESRFAILRAVAFSLLLAPAGLKADNAQALSLTNDLWMRGKMWLKDVSASETVHLGWYNKTNPSDRVVIRIHEPGSAGSKLWRFRLQAGNSSGTRYTVPNTTWDQARLDFVAHWIPNGNASGTLTGMIANATATLDLGSCTYSNSALLLDSFGLWADSSSSTDLSQTQYEYFDNVEYTVPAAFGATQMVTNFFAADLERWTGEYLNRVNGHDFGWTNTGNASGSAGEIGGRFVRTNSTASPSTAMGMPRVLDEQSFTVSAELKLSISFSNGLVVITWPEEYANYQLQYRPELMDPPPWMAVTNAVSISNSLCRVVLQPLGQSGFYRLAFVTPPPSVSFLTSAQSAWENVTPASIPVVLSVASTNWVTVGYFAAGGTATGGGVDYLLPAGPLTFAPGVTNQSIQISINDDNLAEGDETILLALTDPVNAVLGGITTFTYAIVDDDVPTGGPTFQKYETFDNAVSSAGHGWVEYKSRINGNNFGFSNTANAGGTAGEGGGTIARATEGGYYGDTNLYGLLSLERPIAASGRLKFANTSTASSGFRLGHFGARSFDGSGKNLFGFLFQESRVVPASQVRASLRVVLSDGTERSMANTELAYTSGNITYFDYTYDPAASNGLGVLTAHLRNGSSNAVYTATLGLQAGDKSMLFLEAFGIATGNNTSRPDSMDAYIDNVDYTAVSYGAPVLRFAAASSSGLETASPAVLQVVLLAAQTNVVTVSYSATGGTATGGGTDYTLPNGVLTFNPGETLKTIPIPITNDGVDEPDETIIVGLSNPSNNGVLGSPSSHTYTIVDPRPYVSFTAATSSGPEDVSPAHIPVSLSWTSAVAVTVNYAVTGGTATGGGVDYSLANGTLTFAPGETNQSIDLGIVYDGFAEPDETVALMLSNPTHGKLGSITNHTFTILDTAPAVAFATASKSGQKTVTPAVIPVLLAVVSTNTVTVDYSVLTNGTALGSGVDYSLTNGTLTFSPGQTNQTISIAIFNDATNNAPKTIVLGLSHPANARLGSITNHTFTIIGNIPFADTNTVALWLFDETDYFYTTLCDAGPYQYDLNLMDAAHLVAGKYGRALSVTPGAGYNVMYSGFSGSAAHDVMGVRPVYEPLLWGPAVAPEQILSVFATQDWTCEFWLQLPAAPGSEACLFDLGQAYNPGVTFSLAAGTASFNITNAYAGISAVCATSASQLADGQWHHVAFTRAATGGQVKHYLDGQLQSTGTVSAIATTAPPSVVWPSDLSSDTLGMQKTWLAEQRRTNRFNVALGQDRRSNSGLNALMDELRISKVVRYSGNFTPSTFSRNYTVGAPGPALADGLPPLFAGNPPILQMGGRKHVFLDTQLFESTSNLTRMMNPATDCEQINITESMQGSVFERNGRIYMLMTDGYSSSEGLVRVRYSDDGLNFVTPNWGIYGNNDYVLYRQPMYGIAFQDANSNVASNETFKLTAWVSNRGICQYFSDDGIHWRRNETLMLPLVSGGMAESYWDDQRGYYSGLIKRDSSYSSPDCTESGKAAVGFKSAEVLKTWPFAPLAHPHYEDWPFPCVTCEGPTVLPETPVGEVFRARAHKYAWAPDTYLAFIWRNETRKVDLGISRDGDNWTTFATNGVSGPWYVAPFGSYVEVTSLYGIIRRGDELWQYVNYGTSPNSSGPYHYRIKQRLDGFTSVDAGVTTGVAVSKPLLFSGNTLVLNLNASGGAARVGLLDAAGNPIPGFEVSNCDVITANSTTQIVTWQGSSVVGSLAGMTVKLRFEMTNAKLYALQFLP